MNIKLLGIHPDTYESEVKTELSNLHYPVEVEVVWYDGNYSVVTPIDYQANLAWYLTDNPELNTWVNNYWNKYADKSTDN